MSKEKITELRETLCEVGRRMYQREMCATNDGNISVKVDENTFLSTPTGVSKGFMTPDMMCLCDIDGNLLEPNGNYKTTSEFKLHAEIYKLRPDVGSVLHAHPLYATAFASANVPLDKKVSTETTLMLGEVPIIKYGLPGTLEILGDIADYTEYHDAVLMQYHGAVSYGTDLWDAYFKMESLEFCAKTIFIAAQLGKVNELKEIPENELKRLYTLRRKLNLPGKHIAYKEENM